MPKITTAEIQKKICELGKRLGFNSELECKTNFTEGASYRPVTDVGWFINLENYFDLKSLEPLFHSNPKYYASLKKFPFAGFEIEGSTTSSKNQLSNFANLEMNNFYFKFVITNNSEAGTEQDTYRRGLKIHRYCKELFGGKNTFFTDWEIIAESMQNIKSNSNLELNNSQNVNLIRQGTGGETSSLEIFYELQKYIKKTGLVQKQNYEPDDLKFQHDLNQYIYEQLDHNENQYVKYFFHNTGYTLPHRGSHKSFSKLKDRSYIPKIDIALGFDLPKNFMLFLSAVANAIELDVINFPLLFAVKQNTNTSNFFLPLIGIEIETSVNKHLNGGIMNLGNNCFCGILASKKEAHAHFRSYSELLRIKNILFFQI